MDIIASTHAANVGSIENQQRYYILQGAKQGIITTLSATALCIVAFNLVIGLLGAGA